MTELTHLQLWQRRRREDGEVPFVLLWEKGDEWQFINIEWDQPLGCYAQSSSPERILAEEFELVWEADS